jgi:hypothetical protein
MESGLLEGELVEFQIRHAMKKVWMESCSPKLRPPQGTMKEESVFRCVMCLPQAEKAQDRLSLT